MSRQEASWFKKVKDSMRYAIVIEKAQSNYSAYVPDLPGCVATGMSIEDSARDPQVRWQTKIIIQELKYGPTAVRFEKPEEVKHVDLDV